MSKVSVTSVEKVTKGNNDFWMVMLNVVDDNGNAEDTAWIFPTDSLEWRAAEYGIDPSDTATLMDVLLAEAFLGPEDFEEGTRLHEAPDIDAAREAHLARCARSKLRHRMSTRGKDHPLNRVRDESPMNARVLEAKKAHVHTARLAVVQARMASPDAREQEREDRWLSMQPNS